MNAATPFSHTGIFPVSRLFEIKNHHFTGFALGGEKGLWASHSEEHEDLPIST